MLQQFDTLIQLMTAFPNEQSAIDHLRAIRWKNGAICPHCRSTRVYHFSDDRIYKCGDCRKRFSIKFGTIFEDYKISLRKWFMAIWLITSNRKGAASTQLAGDVIIGDQKPSKNIGTILWRLRDKFINFDGYGYWPEDVPCQIVGYSPEGRRDTHAPVEGEE